MPTPGEAALQPCNNIESSDSDDSRSSSPDLSADPRSHINRRNGLVQLNSGHDQASSYDDTTYLSREQSHTAQRIRTEIAHLRSRLAEHAANDTKVEESTNVVSSQPSRPFASIARTTRTESEDTATRLSGREGRTRGRREAAGTSLPLPIATTVTQDAESPQESDASLAHSMSNASITPPSSLPKYLYYPESKERRHAKSTTSFLHPGSKFEGSQTSDKQTYEVHVEIKDVDLEESFLCGYLRIQGLTDDHPTLTTYFQGEIIGPKYKFKTNRPSWGSTEKNDLAHWEHFNKPWKQLLRAMRTSELTAAEYLARDHLFMRWKEDFLVPDHRVKSIAGASFEGFYFICFNQCTGGVQGVYFHAKSEKWQELNLEHVEDHGCLAAMEFR